MKVKSVFKVLLLMQLIWLSACNKSDETEIKNDNLLSETEIRDIGVKHNEALGFVFKSLLAQKETGTKSSIDVETVIKNGLHEIL
ncbi:hypothetical protein [Marinifilum caeruleilacunae]|uniref:Uncharacterized protein n=1 Tax=Marinifilum caeruleilacunae TaxID=2499076 RepID=A0ABX1WZG8_9BACT|nr:hypothetical protein [Marinifilum caeruleilacunae]NOU61268.1 hypothetical protein [Marinifilum caeruleilacunae]